MDLLNCPFCNSAAVLKTNKNITVGHGVMVNKYYIECIICEATSKKFDTYDCGQKECVEKAIFYWNKRTQL